MTDLILPIILLIVGFALLVKGADWFVDGCCAIAKAFRVPSIIIGLTIVALGTSFPEASVSINASITGNAGISAGNCVGSNFFNLLVIVGLCAVFSSVPVSKDILKRDFPISILVEGILLFVFCDFLFGKNSNVLGHAAGIFLFLLYIAYLGLLIYSTLKYRKNTESSADDEIKAMPVWKIIIFVVGGAVAVVVGGDLVVDEASVIARFFGMSETLIGLTIVALGTSLPELVTSIVAAKKGEVDLALGNCIGSNIANFLFVLGLAGTVKPVLIDQKVITDTVILIVVCIITYIMALTNKKLSRREGIIMILMYVVYAVYIFLRDYGIIA